MDYKVNIQRVENSQDSNLKAFANLIFGDSFKVTGIRIYEGKNGLFVAMPNRRTNMVNEHGQPVYKDVCNPITAEFREDLYENILGTYRDVLEDWKNYSRDCVYGDDESLKVTSKITPYEQFGKDIKGIGSVVLNDCFVVKNVIVHDAGEKGTWVSMPTVKNGENYNDICYPITREFREEMYSQVINECEKARTLSNDSLGKEESKQVEREETKAAPKREPVKKVKSR